MKLRQFPLLLAFCLPWQVLAQTDTATEDEEEPIKFYDVELVLFKNLQGPRVLEYSRPSILPVRSESTIDLQTFEEPVAATVPEVENDEPLQDLSYSLIEDEELRLIDQVGKIIRSPRYELMMHAAWRQPGLAFEQSTPVWIRGGKLYGSEYSSIDFRAANYPSATQIANAIDNQDLAGQIDPDALSVEQQELDAVLQAASAAEANTAAPEAEVTAVQGPGLDEMEGQITVSLARFLHVNADLVLRKPRPVGATQAGFYNPQSESQSSRILENHRLKERRRMRSATLHYLDHPHFSMLVMISPYEPELEELIEVEETGDSETLATPLPE